MDVDVIPRENVARENNSGRRGGFFCTRRDLEFPIRYQFVYSPQTNENKIVITTFNGVAKI